jgi:hypothetical protein
MGHLAIEKPPNPCLFAIFWSQPLEHETDSSSSLQKPSSLQVLLGILVSILGVWSWSKLHAPHQYSDSSNYAQDTATGERQHTQGSSHVNVVIERVQPSTPQIEARENRKERRNQRNLLIQGAIAFFACAYATIAFFQWRAQINALKIDQRAWVGVMQVNSEIKHAESTYIDAKIMNSGKTPSLGQEQVYEVLWLPKGTNPNFTYTRSMAEGSFVLFPNSESHSTYTDHIFSQDEVSKIMYGDLVVFMGGTIWYRDVFGNNHTTEYCWILDPKTKGWIACTFHNNAT